MFRLQHCDNESAAILVIYIKKYRNKKRGTNKNTGKYRNADSPIKENLENYSSAVNK